MSISKDLVFRSNYDLTKKTLNRLLNLRKLVPDTDIETIRNIKLLEKELLRKDLSNLMLQKIIKMIFTGEKEYLK